jgi:hypothetical protein
VDTQQSFWRCLWFCPGIAFWCTYCGKPVSGAALRRAELTMQPAKVLRVYHNRPCLFGVDDSRFSAAQRPRRSSLPQLRSAAQCPRCVVSQAERFATPPKSEGLQRRPLRPGRDYKLVSRPLLPTPGQFPGTKSYAVIAATAPWCNACSVTPAPHWLANRPRTPTTWPHRQANQRVPATWLFRPLSVRQGHALADSTLAGAALRRGLPHPRNAAAIAKRGSPRMFSPSR